MVSENKVELNKGLRSGYYDRTESSLIVPKPGKLLYRGYNIHDLAQHSTFEETTYLLLYGSLPTRSQCDELTARLASLRSLPGEVLDTISTYRDSHPMDALRAAVSAMSISDHDVDDKSAEGILDKGIRMVAAAPSMVAAHHRIRSGLDPVEPDSSLTHAASFLHLLFAEHPDPEDARLIDKDLLLHAEHGSNASTFAGRVAASTDADFYSAMTSAVAVLKGPKHGGAAEAVIRMAHDVGSEENAESYVESVIGNRGRIPGFGHPVYQDIDPRSVHLRADAKALGDRKGQPKWFAVIEAVASSRAMTRRAKLGINPNVDLWSGAIYSLLNIPEDLFVPLFAIGRIPGWTLHLLEQYASRDILRPRLFYNGPKDLEYIPMDQRQ